MDFLPEHVEAQQGGNQYPGTEYQSQQYSQDSDAYYPLDTSGNHTTYGIPQSSHYQQGTIEDSAPETYQGEKQQAQLSTSYTDLEEILKEVTDEKRKLAGKCADLEDEIDGLKAACVLLFRHLDNIKNASLRAYRATEEQDGNKQTRTDLERFLKSKKKDDLIKANIEKSGAVEDLCLSIEYQFRGVNEIILKGGEAYIYAPFKELEAPTWASVKRKLAQVDNEVEESDEQPAKKQATKEKGTPTAPKLRRKAAPRQSKKTQPQPTEDTAISTSQAQTDAPVPGSTEQSEPTTAKTSATPKRKPGTRANRGRAAKPSAVITEAPTHSLGETTSAVSVTEPQPRAVIKLGRASASARAPVGRMVSEEYPQSSVAPVARMAEDYPDLSVFSLIDQGFTELEASYPIAQDLAAQFTEEDPEQFPVDYSAGLARRQSPTRRSVDERLEEFADELENARELEDRPRSRPTSETGNDQ